MPKILLFNGPPRSGKDTATEMALIHLGAYGVFYRFAEPLKEAVHALFGLSNVLPEHFTKTKDMSSEALLGMKPRDAYIWLSEECVKPKFGKDFFARIAINTIKEYSDHVIVISDCGFVEELKALVDTFGAENIAIVYMKRHGTSFDNDSRSYITEVECEQFTIENNGSFTDLNECVKKVVESFHNA